MEEEELLEKIELYLIGKMSATERADFEKEIAADEGLAMEVELQRFEHDAMNVLNQNDLRAKMHAWEAKIAIETPVVEPIVETAAEPIAEIAAEPIVEKAVEPIAEIAAEPIVEKADEAIAEIAAEPIVEKADEPIAEIAAEPIVEKAVEKVVLPQSPLTVVVQNEPSTNDKKIIPLPNYWLRFAAAASLVLGVFIASFWFFKGKKDPIFVKTDKPTVVDTLNGKPQPPVEQPIDKVVQTPTKPSENPQNPEQIPPQYNDLLAYVDTQLDENSLKMDAPSRGENGNSEAEMKQIQEAYKAKNYAQSLALLQKQPTNYITSEQLGLVYFKQKAYEKAISSFKSAINDPKAAFSKENIEWNLVLCYAVQYPAKTTELNAALNNILEDTGHKHFEDAKTLKARFMKK